MTRHDMQRFRKLAKLLRDAANLANLLDAMLDNGAEIGCVVGGIADELDVKLQHAVIE